ncbi:hypothetical protein [Pelagerythrobacter marensis]|uniref:Uncharacterized protein n=1 Tax=Pelagerythrobacter marensis TaxID=543877 RepID=A0A0G3X7T4_9SPHN|nr:hypothetical protein [Pelagerythrobacter marensis]AKM06659.1 hypothetical protein AM2010_573 [Pelagerythrobacter marensis]
MDEIIPYMLIVLMWHPDHSGEFVIDRRPVLYETEDACEEAGNDYVDSRAEYAFEFGGARFAFECLPVPARSEYTELFKEWDRRLEERAESR